MLRLAGHVRGCERRSHVIPGPGIAAAGQDHADPVLWAQPGDGRRREMVKDFLAQSQCLVPHPAATTVSQQARDRAQCDWNCAHCLPT